MNTHNRNFAQMSTKILLSLLDTASPEDAVTIRNIINARQASRLGLENKFTIIKHMYGNTNFVVREFDNENDAKKFIDLLRRSECLNCVRYSIVQTLNY